MAVSKVPKIKTRHVILVMLFISYFGLRLLLELSSPYFSDDFSYFALRQVDHIQRTGLPLHEDQLSFQGRTYVFLPLYYYLLAGFAYLLPKILAIKLLNNFFASLVIIFTYVLCSKIVKNRQISLLCAFVAAFIPSYLNSTLNNVNTLSVIYPGIFIASYLFLGIEQKARLDILIPLTIALTLISQYMIIYFATLGLFMAIRKLEKIPISRLEWEYSAFSFLFFLWINFIYFKNAFLESGIGFLLNTPQLVLTQLDIVSAISSIGIFPFVFGMATVYNYVFKIKNKSILLFVSMFLVTTIAMAFNIVPFEISLTFLGGSLVILFGQFVRDSISYLKMSKFSMHTDKIFIGFVILVSLTQILPGILLTLGAESSEESLVDALTWLRLNSPTDAVVFNVPDDGNKIGYYANRSYVADTDPLLVMDAEKRYSDINELYAAKFRIEALRILERYGSEYILFSDKAKEISPSLGFVDGSCIIQVYDKGVQIFKWEKQKCELKTG